MQTFPGSQPDLWKFYHSAARFQASGASFLRESGIQHNVRDLQNGCADRSSHPHWLTWAPVDCPQPDFHRKEFYGTLEFDVQPNKWKDSHRGSTPIRSVARYP